MNHSPSELLKLCVARARQDASAVFVGDEMPKGMQGMKGGMNGGNKGGSGGGGEANAPEESLDAHIKHFHNNVKPEKPCDWMIKHGYGEVSKGGLQNGQSGNVGGATGNAAAQGGNVQMTPVTHEEIEQAEGELKRNNGKLGLTTQQGADNVAQIEQLYRQAKTPEQKKAIDRIYKNLQKKLGRNPTEGEFSDAHKADVENTERIKKEVADENARAAKEEEDNKRAESVRKEKQDSIKERTQDLKADYKAEFQSLVNRSKKGEIDEKTFETRSRKLEEWFFSEIDKLEEEGKKVEGMSAQELNAELQSKVDAFMKSKYVPKARKNPTPAMQKFQASLKAATERQYPSFAKRVGKGMLTGILKAMGETDESIEELKQSFNKTKEAIKAYKARPMKNGGQPSKHYSVLRSVLEKVEKVHDGLRNAALKVPGAVKKGLQNAYSGAEPPKGGEVAKGATGQTGSAEAPRKKLNALRRMHGTVSNLSAPEAQTLIDDLESEYANAKTTKDRMAVMKQFLSLQEMMGGRADYHEDENGVLKRPTKLADIEGLTPYERKGFDNIQSEYAKALAGGNEDEIREVEELYNELVKSKKEFAGAGFGKD